MNECLFGTNEPKASFSLSLTFHILDFFSKTVERKLLKLDRKQDLNVLHQVCVFRVNWKIKDGPQPLIGWDIFDFFSKTA